MMGVYPLKFKVTQFEEERKATFPNFILKLMGRPTFAYRQRKTNLLLTKKELFSTAKEKWITAMEEEMSSMDKNTVWELVDLLFRRETIGNKWVLKIKRKANGSIDKYKARLMAKGYTQQLGVDYEETFFHVVRFASIHLILAIIAQLDLELYQMDAKTTFLNGELDNEIYMDQPLGFEAKG
ncbi:hypothetical protein TB2_022311 [Malus domestica]